MVSCNKVSIVTYFWKRLVHNGPFFLSFPSSPSVRLTVLISCCKIHAILYERGKGNREVGGERREGIKWMNRVRDIYMYMPYQHDPHDNFSTMDPETWREISQIKSRT